MFMSVLATSETHAAVTVTAMPLHDPRNVSQQNTPVNHTDSKNDFFVEPHPENAKIQEQSQELAISLISATTTTVKDFAKTTEQSQVVQEAMPSLGPNMMNLPPLKPPQSKALPENSASKPIITAAPPAEKKKTSISAQKNLMRGQPSLKRK